MKNNLVNFHLKDLDRYIYRIMPVHRLFEIFESNEITLVDPEKWDDPFENLVLKGFIDGVFDEYPAAKVIRNHIYGQCWTLHKETDAMWRIYSADKQGVKVRCTARNLLTSILENNTAFDKEGIYLGKVDYVPQKTLLTILQSSGLFGADVARTLLLKRQEFKHEAEVRLIFTRASKEVKKLKIKPEDVFDEIVFDPRMNKHIYNSYAQSILSNGYSKRVAQSLMYQLPKELRNGI